MLWKNEFEAMTAIILLLLSLTDFRSGLGAFKYQGILEK